MALQMATNISPSTFAGVGGGVFDAEKGLQVSWQVNGNSPMTAYQIVLQKYDNNSTNLYTTGRVALASPFYGVLADGTVQYFEAETITAETLAEAGVTNGNSYKMVITQWWGATSAESITQSSAAVIEAWSEPTITINAYDSPIHERAHTFSATYEQAEDDPVVWVRWVLYDRSRNDLVLEDTGEIYGTSQLEYSYEAFFTGTIYGLEVMIETQSGQQATSGIQTIYVSYVSGSAVGKVLAQQKCGWNGVNVNWDSAKNMVGTAYGDYAFTGNNELSIDNGGDVMWDTEAGKPILFQAPYSIAWVGQLPAGNAYTPVSTSVSGGEISISIKQSGNQTSAQLLVNGNAAATVSIGQAALGSNAMIYLLLTPGALHVTLKNADGSITQASAETAYSQASITSVRLAGPQVCQTLWIEQGTMPGPIDPTNFEPAYTKTTYFLTAFANHDLNAGNSDTTGYALYRLDNTSGEYRPIAELDVNQTGLIDYGAKNEHSYTYQLWYMSDTIFTRQPFESNPITPCRWNVLLIAARKDAKGVYHPQSVYAFGCNVELGDESNNNKSTVQDTFTPYPNYQQSGNLYRTGKLTALIGKIDPATNQYIDDTADYVDEIMQLSTSGLTLFLRDRKGNFRIIRTNGAITQKINAKWPNQAATVTIPWVEVGDASTLSVVLTDEDDLWPYDKVFDTAVYVDAQTGHLMWETAENYIADKLGSVLYVSGGRLMQQFDGGNVKMAEMSIDRRMHLIAEQ